MEPIQLGRAVEHLRAHWLRLTLWMIAGSIVGIAISFLVPPTYRSKGVILPPEEDELTSSLSISKRSLGNLGALGRLGSYFTQADVALAILRSRTVQERVVEALDLQRVYKAKSLEDAVRRLEKKVKIRMASDGSISVQAEDGSRDRAADVANAYLDELDRYNQHFRSFRGRRIRQFLERRLIECDSALALAEARLAAYQKESGTILVSPDAASGVEGAGDLLAQIVAAEVELELLRGYSSPGSEEVVRQDTRVRELRRQIGALPGSQVKGATILRDWTVQQQLFALLTAQLEQARIREAMDTPTIEVLDRAIPAQRHAWPKRSWIGLFGALVGLAVATLETRVGLPQFLNRRTPNP